MELELSRLGRALRASMRRSLVLANVPRLARRLETLSQYGQFHFFELREVVVRDRGGEVPVGFGPLGLVLSARGVADGIAECNRLAGELALGRRFEQQAHQLGRFRARNEH